MEGVYVYGGRWLPFSVGRVCGGPFFLEHLASLSFGRWWGIDSFWPLSRCPTINKKGLHFGLLCCWRHCVPHMSPCTLFQKDTNQTIFSHTNSPTVVWLLLIRERSLQSINFKHSIWNILNFFLEFSPIDLIKNMNGKIFLKMVVVG